MAFERKLRSWLIVLLAAFVGLELFSLAALALLARIKHITYAPTPVYSITKLQRTMLEDFLAGRGGDLTYSSILGWTAHPSGRAPLYRANPTGPRGDRGYTRAPRQGVLRIATFGDFVVGLNGVKEEDSWPEVMMRTQRNVEVLNFGVRDAGIDQAFLRYEHDGAAYKPDIVIIGFFPDNIDLSVNAFRPFLYPNTDLPLAKPRYVLRSGRLVLLPTPLHTLQRYADLLSNPASLLPALGRHDYYYQSGYHRGGLALLPSVRLYQILRNRLVRRGTGFEIEKDGVYNIHSEAFKVTAAIFDEFVGTARRAGAVPIIVVMPRASEIDGYRRGGKNVYAPLLERFQAKGYRYVDLLDGFEKYGKTLTAAELAPSQYSPVGNKLVAKALWQFLVAQRLTDPKNLRSH